MNISKLPKGIIVPNDSNIPNVYNNYLISAQNRLNDITAENNSINEKISKSIEEMNKEKEKRYNDSVIREQRMIELLESIDKNTSVLSDIFNVLEENTKDQKAILDIIGDFNSLATINEPEKAQNKYRKIMNKLNTILTDANTIATLCSYGNMVYNLLHSMGKI